MTVHESLISVVAACSSPSSFIGVLLSSLLVCYASLISYRLYFHPLASIPGPKLAAASTWYEFYYDCVKKGGGQYNGGKIQEMHDHYGPIVRITPREVHIRDALFFDQLHGMSSKLNKDRVYYTLTNQMLAPVATPSHELHRIRRAAINKPFSPTAIIRIEPLLRDRLQAVFKRLDKCQETGIPEPLGDALKSYSTDIVNCYTLPNAPFHLEDRSFEAVYNSSIQALLRTGFINIHFPFIWALLEAIPLPVLENLMPAEQYGVFARNAFLQKNAALVAETKGNPPEEKNRGWPLILNELYKNPALPASEKTARHMVDNASSLTAAGGETAGSTMGLITYQLLRHPNQLKRLREELATVRSLDDPTAELSSYKAFEKLPYLNACITEGLRVYTPLTGRLPRYNPTQPIIYGKYSLPAGTIVSMSIGDMHWDPDVFGPDPHDFVPERWLVPDKELRVLERHWAPFGRGSRNCVGQNLAMAEMQMVLGNLFTVYGDRMKLFETSEKDMKMFADLFVPIPAPNSRGLRVTVD